MTNTTKYITHVGIDISKLTLDVWVAHTQDKETFYVQLDNTPEGFQQLHRWLLGCGAAPQSTIVCGEHTGRYGEHLARWAGASCWDYALVKTTALNKVRPEHHRKSDRYDAALLAEYARRYTDKLSLHKPLEETINQLKRLRKERRFMVDQRARLTQKVKEAAYHDADMSEVRRCYQQQVQLLTKQITWLERHIQQLIHSKPALAHRYAQLQSVPGMGKVIGCFWLGLFAGCDQLNPRQISSRFGFAPHGHRSGTSVKGAPRSSGFGNGDMRRIMHQAARSVSTHHPHFKHYYQKKLREGKQERLIMNNIINKIIRTACSVWNANTCYDPNYMLTMKKNTLNSLQKS